MRPIGILYLALLSLNCHAGNADSNSGQDEQGKYFFQMPPEKEKAIREKTHILKKGMTLEQVVQIFGRPDSNEARATKREGKFIDRELIYYFKIWEEAIVNECKDSYLSVYLDQNSVVTKYHIKEINELSYPLELEHPPCP